ncbi:MAG: exonuclease SbcCD subunit D [Firmicutes bacterium]|nr:exonuclease SbcCD subunit D [Bacillota bacterium]
MRILHTSDWHLGRSLEGRSRIDEQVEFIEELAGIAEDEGADLVLIAGDVFDAYNPSAEAEKLFFHGLELLSKKGQRGIVVIAGNHDSPERLSAVYPLAYHHGIVLLGLPNSCAMQGEINGERGIKVLKAGPGWLEVAAGECQHTCVILTLPYPSESRLGELLSDSIDEKVQRESYSRKVGAIFAELSNNFRDDTVNIAVSHLFIRGGKESESERQIQLVGGTCSVDPNSLPDKAHYVALGHLHRPQQVNQSPVPAYYSGSPIAYSFSEAGQTKAVFLVDAVPNREVEIKEIHLSSGRPLVRWTAKNGLKDVYKWCEEGRDSNAWIDLEVYTPAVLSQGEIQKIRELRPRVVNIRPVLPQTSEIVGEIKKTELSIDQVFRRFYERKTGGHKPDDALVKLFMELLISSDERDSGEGGTVEG